ncbi:MAG TPA: phosphocholine cytidylyltransferase family protein [Bacteroidota bacterium]|nr:phosphocholine cytidylyltransferase family protein [Bacteroidota bacterium]
MKCIILAAGRGERLRPLTDSTPKCLLDVGGKPLLHRTIEQVLHAGISEIGIVLGYRAEDVRTFVTRRFPATRIRFISNPKFSATNNAFSLLMARDFYKSEEKKFAPLQELLLVDCDILFAPELLKTLLDYPQPNRLAVQARNVHHEEEIRVKVDSNSVVRLIGKSVPISETFGESIGIEVFAANTASRLFDVLERRVRAGVGRTEFYEASFQELIDDGVSIHAVDVSTFPAIEIDTQDDLRAAETIASLIDHPADV